MKFLPLISKVSELSFGTAMQIKTGQPLVIEQMSYKSFDPLLQCVFKGMGDKIIVVYVGMGEKVSVAYVNMSFAYNAVISHYGANISKDIVKREIPKFAEIYGQSEKVGPLFFSHEGNAVLLTKQFPSIMISSSEDLQMCTFGMLQNFTKDILEEIDQANIISGIEAGAISEAITQIKNFFE